MSKIAILGGTFDPFHNGHLEIARKAALSGIVDRLIIMPAKVSPFKQGREMASEEDRYEMVRLAVKDIPGIEVSRLELDSEEVSYTFFTLESLSETYPGDELWLIVGTDQFLALDSWYKGVDILMNFGIILARRPDHEEDDIERKTEEYRSKYGTGIEILENDYVDVSSTSVKEMIGSGASIEGMVPEVVEKYIYEHGLYRENDQK